MYYNTNEHFKIKSILLKYLFHFPFMKPTHIAKEIKNRRREGSIFNETRKHQVRNHEGNLLFTLGSEPDRKEMPGASVDPWWDPAFSKVHGGRLILPTRWGSLGWAASRDWGIPYGVGPTLQSVRGSRAAGTTLQTSPPERETREEDARERRKWGHC